jgi:hypothetical protein
MFDDILLDLEPYNIEADEDNDTLLTIDSAIDELLTVSEITDRYDADLVSTIIEAMDHDSALSDFLGLNNVYGKEAIEVKIRLELADLNKLWKIITPVVSGISRRYQAKVDAFKDSATKYESVFKKEVDPDKFINVKHSALLHSKDIDALVGAFKGLNSTIPKSIPIIKSRGEYNRIIKAFNFNKDMQTLSVKMGTFVSAGKSKQRNAQFYTKTSFDFPYYKNVTMAQMGFPNTMSKLKTQYDNQIGIFLDTINTVNNNISAYGKGTKGMSGRLSKLPNDSKGNATASIQIKLMNEYFKMLNKLYPKLDMVHSRIISQISGIRKIS